MYVWLAVQNAVDAAADADLAVASAVSFAVTRA
jgi:hypothetical protein